MRTKPLSSAGKIAAALKARGDFKAQWGRAESRLDKEQLAAAFLAGVGDAGDEDATFPGPSSGAATVRGRGRDDSPGGGGEGGSPPRRQR